MSTTAGLRDQGLPSTPKTRYKGAQDIPAAAGESRGKEAT
jgi:hypothetical protein